MWWESTSSLASSQGTPEGWVFPVRVRWLLLVVSLGCFCAPTCFAANERSGMPPVAAKPIGKAAPDGRQLEKDLQGLSWKQFRSVVEAIPPLRAEVEKYGPLGWQYVQTNYKTYPWRKPLGRLSDSQRIELARLIERARKSR